MEKWKDAEKTWGREILEKTWNAGEDVIPMCFDPLILDFDFTKTRVITVSLTLLV